MIITSADAEACYDRVNHVVMSLVWLVLLNGNAPAIVAALLCLQTMKFFQRTGFGESKTFFGGPFCIPYIMGLGQGSRSAPPSWIQLSSVIVNVYKSMGFGAKIVDPITGITFIGNIDLEQTNIDNADLRWEYFFGSGEMISASAFFKNFTKIERWLYGWCFGAI